MGVQAGDFSYLGVGKVFLREKGAPAPRLHIGNVSVLNFGVTEDVKEQRDYTQVGGGTVAESRRISAVECGMTLHDLDKDNLARAFFGSASEFATEAVAGEVQLGYVGGFVPTNKPIDTSVAVVVEMGATTFVLGADYTVSSGGITILDGGDIEDGDALEISYTTLDHQTMEALTTFAKEYELYFEGLNEAKSGRAVNVAAHRIKFGATQVLDLINEDFASFEVKGKLLRDNTKQGAGVSKYFKVQIALGE